MARQASDRFTLSLPGIDAPIGRPRKEKVKSGAQRTREWRQRKADKLLALRERLPRLSDVLLARFSVGYGEGDDLFCRECWHELGRRKGWL